jgi:hypothetical protein
MLLDPDALVRDFVALATPSGWVQAMDALTHERQLAPHQPHGLPGGRCAVYVFSLSSTYGELCPAGPHRVLKIGKAGPRSSARFQSQHYGSRRAPSTLAGKLVTTPEVWAYLRIGRQDSCKGCDHQVRTGESVPPLTVH